MDWRFSANTTKFWGDSYKNVGYKIFWNFDVICSIQDSIYGYFLFLTLMGQYLWLKIVLISPTNVPILCVSSSNVCFCFYLQKKSRIWMLQNIGYNNLQMCITETNKIYPKFRWRYLTLKFIYFGGLDNLMKIKILLVTDSGMVCEWTMTRCDLLRLNCLFLQKLPKNLVKKERCLQHQ